MNSLEDNKIICKLNFFNDCDFIEQDFRGHSSALRFICEKGKEKYFVKIYGNNRVNDLKYIDSVYKKCNVLTANIVEMKYLDDINKTYVVYEYINGKTLLELTCELNENELETIGFCVGKYLFNFRDVKCCKNDIIELYEKEFNQLVDNLYYMKNYYDRCGNNKLFLINLDRFCKSFNECKKFIYRTNPSFIHRDINLNNVIVSDYSLYFIDTDGGKIGFRALDFRGVCWWTFDGDNVLRERAIYRGIFEGLFDGDIPDSFDSELSFTIMYEFLLKIFEVRRNFDMKRMEYIFNKFGDIFIKTNYFENYKFEWFGR